MTCTSTVIQSALSTETVLNQFSASNMILENKLGTLENARQEQCDWHSLHEII